MTAYQDIFAVLEETQHRHLIRVWNYLPDINREADGEERYRHFNAARQCAFQHAGRSTVGTVPAACALGSPAGSPISIYFLASRRPADAIREFERALAFNSRFLEARFDLGLAQIQLERFHEAVSNFQQILREIPDDYENLNYLGVALSGAGKDPD